MIVEHPTQVSHLHVAVLFQLRAAGLPEPEQEFKFAPNRRYRFDLAWPACSLALEISGGTWGVGGHSTGQGIQRDYEKLNLAVVLGWRVLQADATMVRDGRALRWVERALEAARANGGGGKCRLRHAISVVRL